MSTTTDVLGPAELPVAGSQIDTLLGALDRNRRTFASKVFGLSAEETHRTLGASTMSLAGLAKHVALVEDYYFALGLGGEMPQPWRDVDFDADPDWDWHSAADGSPDAEARWSARSQKPNLRPMLVDMVEEYVRHTGHADLIRESIDGLVGEGLPPEEASAG
jgi:hypothetical protein